MSKFLIEMAFEELGIVSLRKMYKMKLDAPFLFEKKSNERKFQLVSFKILPPGMYETCMSSSCG